MKEKSIKEYLAKRKKLTEELHVPGLDFLGAEDGVEVYDARTWYAAQQLIADDNESPAGEEWARSEDTFNININDTTHLYFFVLEGTNRVINACISVANPIDVSVNDTTVRLNYQFQNLDDQNRLNCGGQIPDTRQLPIHLLPGILPFLEFPPQGQNAEAEAEPNAEVETEHDIEIEVEQPEADAAVETPAQQGNQPQQNAQVQQQPQRTEEQDPATLLRYRNVGKGITIFGCKKGCRKLKIPEQINGKPVTDIAPFAFYGNNTLSHVLLPPTIKTIGKGAFANPEIATFVHYPRTAKVFSDAFSGSATGLPYEDYSRVTI